MSQWPLRSLENTIERPSGVHAGCAACATSFTAGPPADGAMKTSAPSPWTKGDMALRPDTAPRRPPRSCADTNAMRVPSGDHAGCASSAGVAATRRSSPPSTGITTTSSEPRSFVV